MLNVDAKRNNQAPSWMNNMHPDISDQIDADEDDENNKQQKQQQPSPDYLIEKSAYEIGSNSSMNHLISTSFSPCFSFFIQNAANKNQCGSIF